MPAKSVQVDASFASAEPESKKPHRLVTPEVVIELGSGSGRKTIFTLIKKMALNLFPADIGSSSGEENNIDIVQRPIMYVPLDISAQAISEANDYFNKLLEEDEDMCTKLTAEQRKYLKEEKMLTIRGVVGEFAPAIREVLAFPAHSRTWMFMGSSLGNYNDDEITDFLTLVSSSMSYNDRFLLALDCAHSETKPVEKIV